MTHLDVKADHSMMRPAEKMLIILVAGILLISCASGDNQSTMAALGSGAVFTQKDGNQYPLRLFEPARLFVGFDHVARLIENANQR